MCPGIPDNREWRYIPDCYLPRVRISPLSQAGCMRGLLLGRGTQSPNRTRWHAAPGDQSHRVGKKGLNCRQVEKQTEGYCTWNLQWEMHQEVKRWEDTFQLWVQSVKCAKENRWDSGCEEHRKHEGLALLWSLCTCRGGPGCLEYGWRWV